MNMVYRRLFIWVEGPNDERFFERIIKPKLREKYDLVQVVTYKNMKKEKVVNFFKSIKSMNADYIYTTDINTAPCITAKKQEIRNELKNIGNDKISVVIKEIESWYLAGLNDIDAEKFKIPPFKTTDDITKERFDNLIPKNLDSRLNFMLEILENFSVEKARQKNKSFEYFIEKHNNENYGIVGNFR